MLNGKDWYADKEPLRLTIDGGIQLGKRPVPPLGSFEPWDYDLKSHPALDRSQERKVPCGRGSVLPHMLAQEPSTAFPPRPPLDPPRPPPVPVGLKELILGGMGFGTVVTLVGAFLEQNGIGIGQEGMSMALPREASVNYRIIFLSAAVLYLVLATVCYTMGYLIGPIQLTPGGMILSPFWHLSWIPNDPMNIQPIIPPPETPFPRPTPDPLMDKREICERLRIISTSLTISMDFLEQKLKEVRRKVEERKLVVPDCEPYTPTPSEERMLASRRRVVNWGRFLDHKIPNHPIQVFHDPKEPFILDELKTFKQVNRPPLLPLLPCPLSSSYNKSSAEAASRPSVPASEDGRTAGGQGKSLTPPPGSRNVWRQYFFLD